MNGMNTHIQSSIFQSRVKGGTIKAASDVNKKFAGLISKKGEETVSFEKMISSIDGWYESVKADTVETITCTDYYPAPIWELFSEDAEDVLNNIVLLGIEFLGHTVQCFFIVCRELHKTT